MPQFGSNDGALQSDGQFFADSDQHARDNVDPRRQISSSVGNPRG
jgi:hypothetical protein